jgi:hypothetical protein
MPEATLKSFAKEKRLVIATYQDGPISIMPLKVPPPAVETPGAPGAPTSPASPAAAASASAPIINVATP